MEQQLAVFGVNHKSSSLAVRERFWFSESRLYAAISHLAKSAGIEEVVLLVTCNRTEFVLWTSNLSEATESVHNYLTRSLNDLRLNCLRKTYTIL